MKILALDCATKTGWAIAENGKIIESGVQNFKKRRGEGNGILFLRFRKWLQETVDLVQPSVIAYEMAHFRGGSATEICVGLQTRVQEIAAERIIPCLPVTTSEVKTFATGSGKAGKPAMMKASEQYLGRPPIDDNEADAVLIAMFADREI